MIKWGLDSKIVIERAKTYDLEKESLDTYDLENEDFDALVPANISLFTLAVPLCFGKWNRRQDSLIKKRLVGDARAVERWCEAFCRPSPL